jgi:hypothetical protein
MECRGTGHIRQLREKVDAGRKGRRGDAERVSRSVSASPCLRFFCCPHTPNSQVDELMQDITNLGIRFATPELGLLGDRD